MVSHSATTQQEGVSLGTERWVLLSTILASSMAFIDGSALNVALPALQRDLGARGADLLWIVNAYLLFLSALLLVGGSLGDIFGRKRVFMVGIAIFAGASLACGLAPNTGVLIGMRAVQGIGGALMIPGSLAIITALVGAGRRGQAIGTWSAVTSIMIILGPWLGGELASRGLWRGVFFINMPLALIALGILWRSVPESHDEEALPEHLDYGGALLATLGLAGLTYGFIAAPERGFGDLGVLVGLVGGAGALLGFAVVEARGAHPMVPLRLFRSRTFSATNLLTLFLYAALNGALFFLPLNLIQAQGYGDDVAGRAVVPFALALALLSRWAGGLVDRYGPRPPLVVGPAVTGLGFLLLALPGLTDGPGQFWLTFFPGVAVAGVGMGITVAPLTTAVMSAVSSRQSGTASGINNAVARVAGVLAIAILGGVALWSFRSALLLRTADVNLPEGARAALYQAASDLGETTPPESVPPALRDAVQGAIDLAFVDTFRLVVGIAAGLAWTSAVVAFVAVERRPGPA